MTPLLKLEVDTARLVTELCTLAMISEPAKEPAAETAEGVAVTRVVYSPEDVKARGFVEELACEAGMTVRRDAVGNTFFRWQGSEPALGAVATGSHIDAIPNAGMYDGTVGVLGGIASVRALKAAGFEPRRSIDVILFTSEEPTRFGIGCLGSRMMSGVLSAVEAAALRDAAGISLDEARSSEGSKVTLGRCRLRRVIMQASWNCTSSRGRCWKENTFLSVSLRQLPRQPASTSL